ncbi:uncharacterized protein LOC127645748 [Xyrauchen texanus]|uniref:uncharacterized protein LOC127645748 n=1 Tax=Xyrauchen texanus TaxID=154827 RepID=UPI002242B309|nr:uncharacterized protein LOC127645748 [Xyrauchen texanus]
MRIHTWKNYHTPAGGGNAPLNLVANRHKTERRSKLARARICIIPPIKPTARKLFTRRKQLCKAMVYARAVWVENGQQMEGVLPLNWIDTETKVVRWPLKNVSVAHKRLLQPQEDWLSFEFVKVKVTSVSRQECEKYNYTSAQTEEEDTVSQKRMKKRRKFEDYVQGSDLSAEEDESLPDKKKEDTVLLPVPPPKLSHRGPNAMLLQLPAPPELANTAIRQPESPASSDISGCSRPTLHRSPTRSESTEAFSPVSARSRGSRTPQRGVRMPSQSRSRKDRASSSRSRGSCTPQRGVRMPSQSGSRKGRASSSRSRGSCTPQRGVRMPSQSGSRKVRASSSRSRGSLTPQRGVRMTSQSRSRSLFPMSQAKYQKSVLGKLVELLDEIKSREAL